MAASVVQSVTEAPLPRILESLGIAIADAQTALDRSSIAVAQMMLDPEQGVTLGDTQRSLLELGFTPTFYHFTEATIDVKLAFSSAESQEISVGASVGVNVGFFAATVNASYTAKYSFDASGSSSISARLVSLPPPARLNELLQQLSSSNPGT